MFNKDDLMRNPFMTNTKFEQQYDFLKEEGEFDRILKILTVPAKSGIYLSRFDIRSIALALGVDVNVRERKEMLKDLFFYAKQLNKMNLLEELWLHSQSKSYKISAHEYNFLLYLSLLAFHLFAC